MDGRIIVHMNDGEHINISGDRLEERDNELAGYCEKELVLWVDKSAVVEAHLSGKK